MAYKIRAGVAARLIKGNYFIVLPKKMKLVKLNGSGSLVLSEVKKGAEPGIIAKMLAKKYGLSAKKANTDTDLFIKQLLKESIIQKC